MLFNAMTVFVLVGALAVIIGALYWTLMSVGLQEADDPHESDPGDLTEFEKRHTHRPDVHA
jgi:hypothetical protein